jgi:hypothetical protein
MSRIISNVMQVQALAIERRMREAQIAAEQHEARWSGIRSVGLLAAISGVMIFTLVAGTGLI